MANIEDYSYEDIQKAVLGQFRLLTTNKTPSDTPTGYILGGIPGAGKTTIQLFLDREKGNIVAINGDSFREQHPHFNEINEAYGENAANYTQSFANAVTNALFQKLSDEGYNIIIEGTCRRYDIPLKTCNDLKEKGYRTELMIMCVDKETAWQSTFERAGKMKEKGKAPRYVPQEKFEETANAISSNIGKLYSSNAFDDIVLYNRCMNELYRMTNTPSVNPESIADDITNRYGRVYRGVNYAYDYFITSSEHSDLKHLTLDEAAKKYAEIADDSYVAVIGVAFERLDGTGCKAHGKGEYTLASKGDDGYYFFDKSHNNFKICCDHHPSIENEEIWSKAFTAIKQEIRRWETLNNDNSIEISSGRK